MAKYEKVQRDFSGGEISQRMFMRDDLDVHGKALLTMENFMPTLQGTAIRTPGTRFLWEIKDAEDQIDLDARIFPYITPDNQYALVEILPDRGSGGDLRIRQNIASAIGGLPLEGGLDPDNPQTVFKQVVPNHDFGNGKEGWLADPDEYTSGPDTLGWLERSQALYGTARIGVGRDNTDIETCTVSRTVQVPDGTAQLVPIIDFTYSNNFTSPSESKIEGFVRIGTTAGAGDIYEYDFSDLNVGARVSIRGIPFDLPAPAVGPTDIFLTFTFTAVVNNENLGSTPAFLLQTFGFQTTEEVDVSSVVIQGGIPWTPAELREVHFVQSPYYNSGDVAGTFGNELVFTHPKHPPKRLYYNPAQGGYVFQTIPFFYRNTAGVPADSWINVWENGGYPRTCGAFVGRLVLAGSDTSPALGSLSGSLTERIWMTQVGKWNQVTQPDVTELLPDDSIEVTSTYRSPITWVYGQNNLVIGSESYEYVSTADGVYSPGDLGMFLQSTHGSASVQPVPMGQYVLFAAEQGSRVRAMQYVAESEYWVAPDMTLYHPELFANGGGIRRMVRMRNPHQMMVAVMGNGQLALLHQDSYSNISAWSRIMQGNQVRDIVALPKDDGTDVLYMLVERTVGGVERLYLEAISDWTYRRERDWVYTNTSTTFIPPAPTNVITGLDHLNNRNVQVTSGGDFIGTYMVTGGQITMVDAFGDPINVPSAVIGQAMSARIRTMPLITQDADALKRYSELYVRVRNSSRPMINGVRPPDRDAQQFLGTSQELDIIDDWETQNFGWNRTQVVEVRENLPVRTEVVGIFGKVKSNSL